jgi:tRNA-specific 2-thiouridylase
LRRRGPVRHVDGTLLGEHAGLLGFTIGQRKGTGAAAGERLYVVRIDATTATLWVGPREATRSVGLRTKEGNLLAPAAALAGEGVRARIRYRHEGAACRVRILGDGRWDVRFATPQPAIAPGQSVVFYREDRVLAGARIEGAIPGGPASRSRSLPTGQMYPSI